jgi:hypothetical protein
MFQLSPLGSNSGLQIFEQFISLSLEFELFFGQMIWLTCN